MLVGAVLLAAFSLFPSAGGSQTATYDLVVSSSPDRSGPTPLAGATVAGDIYVFTSPDTGTSRVRFWLDDPSMSGTPDKLESRGPWDFAGTASNGLANPYPTTQLSDGAHSITAEITLSAGGTEVVTSEFTVANGTGEPPPPPPLSDYQLAFSTAADRSSPTPLSGESVADDIYVFTSPDTGTSRVRFWLDDPSMSGTADKVESRGPWDFAGSASNGNANPYDTTQLADGTHSITAEITLLAGGTEVITSEFTVANGTGEPPPPPPPSDYQLVFSTAAERSSPTPLSGESVADDIYVFTSPETGTSRVRFWLDEPGMTGTPDKVESRGPWDFAGSASNGNANPYDTTQLADGTHSITAEITLSAGGTEIVTSEFLVTNDGPALLLDRTAVSFALLEGNNTASETVGLSATDGSAPAFSASDDAPWLEVTPASGSAPADLDLAVTGEGLATGTYNATVTVSATGYGAASLTVSLSVRDTLVPDQVHLSWVDEPSTTLSVVWRTWDTATPSMVQYRPSGSATWQSATGALRPSGTDGTLHEVTVAGLSPSTEYEYRVQGDGSTWSTVYAAKTAPPPGPADFDAIYVADTGLVGREDGLATGTQQVVDEIAALSPDVVLLGGDYAYYNTDKRYGTLDATIDAWFNQMQPIGSRSPMMPTYGNHEVLLDEGFEFWAPRFATPTGFDGRRFYSFDVGDVHFVSLLAVTETNGLSSSALAWIEDDIEAAKAAGQRWIVPFFHVSPFSDGTSHPSNLGLRGQLGPLFERLGVKIAIASHDQSYERTFPLVDVPATNTPTSMGKRCYTMDDGVTWVKVSPGGKLSNKNGDFSQWRTEPPPAWTAFRDNTMHHFSRLVVSAEGTMRLDTYGVVGDGSPPVIVDTFEYRESCPAELVLEEDELQFAAVAGESAPDQTVSLSAADGSAAGFAVEVDAPWLEVTPTAGGTPTELTVGVDATGLAGGVYNGIVRASADGYVSDEMRVTFLVRDLVVSTSPDRSSPIALEGASVGGNIYVFTTPDPGVDRVRFWLDNPSMSGTPRKVESNGPFDFAGTATNGSANPFNTKNVSNGTHSITATLDLVDGTTQVVTRSFVVSNP